MNDSISKERLMEALGISDDCVNCQHRLNELCLWEPNMVDVCEVITEMPYAEPRWIPVTERLPEVVERFTDAENVLAHDDGTFEFSGVFTEYESAPVLVEGIAEGEHGIFTAIYSMWKYEDGAVETEWLDNIISDIEIKNVTAWMPLPEPWKGGAE